MARLFIAINKEKRETLAQSIGEKLATEWREVRFKIGVERASCFGPAQDWVPSVKALLRFPPRSWWRNWWPTGFGRWRWRSNQPSETCNETCGKTFNEICETACAPARWGN